MDFDRELLKYCETPRQLEFFNLVLENGTVAGASRAMGIAERNGAMMMSRIRKNAERRHYAPDNHINHPLPQQQTSRGVSQLVDEDGNVKLTWFKSKPRAEALYDSLITALEEHKPKPFPSIKSPKKGNQDLLDLFTLTDYHFGMLAWRQECGDSWDMDIAEKTFIQVITEMIEKAKIGQDSNTALLNLQGDLLHYDSLEAVTPSSKHVLDADGRAPKMIEVVMTCCEWAVLKLLESYKEVKVLVVEGNHDLYGSIWLRKHLKAMFRNNKRVVVDDTEFPYYAHLHGEIMLGFHHGHKKKNQDLPALFSCEPRYREMWGKAGYCYIHTGHYHHREKEGGEHSGAVVERHPTIAAADSHAVRGGYVSKRGAYVITYDAKLGEISRASVYPRSVK